MKPPIWLFELTTFGNDDYEPLMAEAHRQGFEVRTTKYIPFGERLGLESLAPLDACLVFYGSLNYAKYIQRNNNQWVPGVFCNFPAFNCSTYYPHVQRLLLNSDWKFVPFLDLLYRENHWFEKTKFVRPNAGDKIFTGGLVSSYRLPHTCDISDLSYGHPADFNPMTVVSSPKDILAEYRFVVADRKVIAGAQYKDESGNSISQRLTEEQIYGPSNQSNVHYPGKIAQSMADIEWQPERVYTVDVAQTESMECKLLELNSFSCSGLYGCNPEPIIREVSRIASEMHTEYWND